MIEHWERIYETKLENEFSWFQSYPQTSIDFVNLFTLPLSAKIIDIGGGDSHLVDALLQLRYSNITVLDISAKAIDRAKLRLGEKANAITWVVSDVTEFKTDVQFDFWHDRAAFHFLTSPEAISKYLGVANQSIKAGGHLVLGTFSTNGPTKCSGLEIHQYSEASMSLLFDRDFKRIKCVEENHLTPFKTTQNFLFCSFERRKSQASIF
jgi:2-polyprenyl-3-methyl-5-hydroxy-6-metoxy-1,4-benzoquinol methylase